MPALVWAHELVEKSDRALNPKAGRVLRLEETIRMTDGGGEFFSAIPRRSGSPRTARSSSSTAASCCSSRPGESPGMGRSSRTRPRLPAKGSGRAAPMSIRIARGLCSGGASSPFPARGSTLCMFSTASR